MPINNSASAYKRSAGILIPLFVSADQAATSPGTQTQSRHEHRDHDGGQGGGDSELGHCQPQPDDLVENAAESRDQKQ